MCLTLIVDKLGGEDARRNSGNENVELERSRPPDQEDLWDEEMSDKFRFHNQAMTKTNIIFLALIIGETINYKLLFESKRFLLPP